MMQNFVAQFMWKPLEHIEGRGLFYGRLNVCVQGKSEPSCKSCHETFSLSQMIPYRLPVQGPRVQIHIGYLLPWWRSGKDLPANAGDTGDAGLILGSGRFPGEENGNLLQYSFLENPMDRGAWWGTVHGIAKSQT